MLQYKTYQLSSKNFSPSIRYINAYRWFRKVDMPQGRRTRPIVIVTVIPSLAFFFLPASRFLYIFPTQSDIND